MSEYYEGAYKKRLNRYGLDYQSRIQSQRERDFNNYLYKTIYRVDFEFGGNIHPGSLERSKQDYSETQAYLLTRIDLKMPSGTILNIQSRDGTVTPWMVWWLERIEASGYNKYLMLKMTHLIKWEFNGVEYEQWTYFSGPGNATIQDSIRSAGGRPLYKENNNLHLLVTGYNEFLLNDIYFEMTYKNTTQGYKVIEFDINSTPGVSYISIDPVPLQEKRQVPEKQPEDKEEDFFWFGGDSK